LLECELALLRGALRLYEALCLMAMAISAAVSVATKRNEKELYTQVTKRGCRPAFILVRRGQFVVQPWFMRSVLDIIHL